MPASTSGWTPILAAHARLRAQADAVVVEGVGGWAAPLVGVADQADVVRALGPAGRAGGRPAARLPQPRYLSVRAIAADGCRLRAGSAMASSPTWPVARNISRCWPRSTRRAGAVLPHEPLADGAALSRYLTLPD
jgi:dethiobiotin synthetase